MRSLTPIMWTALVVVALLPLGCSKRHTCEDAYGNAVRVAEGAVQQAKTKQERELAQFAAQMFKSDEFKAKFMDRCKEQSQETIDCLAGAKSTDEIKQCGMQVGP